VAALRGRGGIHACGNLQGAPFETRKLKKTNKPNDAVSGSKPFNVRARTGQTDTQTDIQTRANALLCRIRRLDKQNRATIM